MAWIKGFNFRLSGPFVSDPANHTFTLGSDVHPVPRNGVYLGYTAGLPQPRDRDNSLDPRLAGTHFTEGTAAATWRVDMPSSGVVKVYTAVGDSNGAISNGIVSFFDDATLKFAIDHATGFTTATDRWRDAMDVLLDDEDAVAGVPYGSPRTVTFASTILNIVLGTASRLGAISHLLLVQEDAAPVVVPAVAATPLRFRRISDRPIDRIIPAPTILETFQGGG